jgi:hypothetical protein
MTLLPERFLRFAIRDLEAQVAKTPDEEKSFWLKRLHEYYAIEHGDLHEHQAADMRQLGVEIIDKITKVVIDLGELLPENFTFVGFDKGVGLREELDLSREWLTEIRIVFPLNTYVISYTFFKGLFGESIHEAGTSDAFFKKHIIECPEHLREVLRVYVRRILYTEPV